MIGLARGVFAPDLPASRPELAALCEAIQEALDLTGREFDLQVAGDGAIEALNREFLGLPGPTNILSFPAEDPDRPDYLGEMALSLDAVSREAFLYGQPPGLHMARLLAHGFLHLAGLDHGPLMESLTETAAEAAADRLGLAG
ncbi:Metal-dependent hydrolase YbeY, involved in rRNA and/or ribosome maturation and assembly [Desulfovibrio sp. DV]|uniref:rRNA maturation RNase YbeY n=1 Tax=Desulfovibrio sp. DV TaxID=1844708 RepID=UPI00094BA74E|nr:rRNA maturation RNase YbeY [Desulfovibrio sp. DV]OLN26908.1 Metal-dependent hydrolase YbeY, involved in rRNA and/or ribosome maturation and assembly [Desulfovibrio sp. DV]